MNNHNIQIGDGNQSVQGNSVKTINKPRIENRVSESWFQKWFWQIIGGLIALGVSLFVAWFASQQGWV